MNMQPTMPLKPVMSERRVSLLGALLVAIGPVAMSLFTPAMPEIVQAFGTTEAAVKMTLSLYFAGFALAQLVCGPLSDGFGRKPVTFAFLGIFMVASLLAMVAPNIHFLIAARFLQGVGAAVGWSISRAVVRDLFTHERAARIINLMVLILGVGPAFAPTLGGLTMNLFGWHAVFILMFGAAVLMMIMIAFFMVETIERDLSRIKPKALIDSYRTILGTRYFVLASVVLGGTIGALYTQATVLPFILMERVGLTPTQFGAAMLMQSGFFFLGNVVVRLLLKRHSIYALLPFGLVFVALGALALAIGLRALGPSFLSVMGPVGSFSFGVAFVVPAMSTAALAPFPRAAGAASSMSGFFQMGGGLIGGIFCALYGDPVMAMATIIPSMGLIAIVSWFLWRRLPEPYSASIVATEPQIEPVVEPV